MTTNISGPADPDDLRQLVARVLELPASEIADHTDFVNELDVDSLLRLELLIRLEKHYGITISEAEIVSFTSLAAVRDLVDRLLGAEPTGADPTL
ncbi:acyl carrier protein [Nocardia sp. NPDC057227]|uniref:acyl carrier protein n=1 Tax=Nocardia sp. NPDC057227 TaxID=3346056 RepID=UPI003643ABB8